MNEAGLVVVTALISPMTVDRQTAREIIGAERFYEIHVSTPVATCEGRDPKRLYRRAKSGELREFAGVSAPCQSPADPVSTVDSTSIPIDQTIEKILVATGLLRPGRARIDQDSSSVG